MKFYVSDKEIKQIKQSDDVILARTVTRPDGVIMTRRELISRLLDGIEDIEMTKSELRHFVAAIMRHLIHKIKVVKRKELPHVIEPTVKIYVIVSRYKYDKHAGKKNKLAFWNKIIKQDFDARRKSLDGKKAIFEIRLGVISTYNEIDGTGKKSQLEDFIEYLKKHSLINSYTLGMDKFRKYLNNDEWTAKETIYEGK